jgi:hypothetical protein
MVGTHGTKILIINETITSDIRTLRYVLNLPELAIGVRHILTIATLNCDLPDFKNDMKDLIFLMKLFEIRKGGNRDRKHVRANFVAGWARGKT